MTFHFSRSLASTNISAVTGAVLLPSQAAIPSCIFYSLTTSASFPSIFPVVNKCSSFLITWPRNSACLLLTLLISFLVLLAVFRMSKLVLFSVHDTLSILLKSHISIASRVGVDYKSPITLTVPIKLSITITVVIEKAITITILRLQLLVYHGNDSRLFIRHVHLQYYHA